MERNTPEATSTAKALPIEGIVATELPLVLPDGQGGVPRLSGKHTPIRVAAKNTIWLGLGQGVASAFTLLLAVYMGRHFGVEDYGRFAFALSYGMLFSTLFDFGLSTVVTREFARDEGNHRHFGAVLALKLGIGILTMGVLALSAILFIHEDLTRTLVLILGAYVFLQELVNLSYARYRAQQRMEREAAFRLMQVVVAATLVVALLSWRGSLVMVAGGLTLSVGVTLVAMSGHALRSRAARSTLRGVGWVAPQVWKSYLTAGWYLALARGVGSFIMNTDIVILGGLGKIAEVGLYAAALRVNGLLLFPMAIVATAMLPALIGVIRTSTERFTYLVERWIQGVVLWCCFFVATIWAVSDQLVTALYGEGFGPAAGAVRIVVVAAAVNYVHTIILQVLLIHDDERSIFRIMALASVLNVVLNLALIPALGLFGASIALVTSHAVILVCFVSRTRRHVRLRFPTTTLAMGLLAGTASFLTVIAARSMAHVGLIGGVTWAVLSYGLVCAVLFGVARLRWGSHQGPGASVSETSRGDTDGRRK